VILKETILPCLIEKQIRWEPVPVSTNRLIKYARLNAIKQSQITIKDYGFVANGIDFGRKSLLSYQILIYSADSNHLST
jgi:hypothetical protein